MLLLGAAGMARARGVGLLALILIIIFSVWLNWLPAMGAANDPGLLPYLRHIALPTVALALIPLGVITRYTRSGLKSGLTPDP